MSKNFNDPQYWDHFSRGVLAAEDRPTIPEVCNHIALLGVKLAEKDREILRLKNEINCAAQRFDDFATEVQNLAHKRRTLRAG